MVWTRANERKHDDLLDEGRWRQRRFVDLTKEDVEMVMSQQEKGEG